MKVEFRRLTFFNAMDGMVHVFAFLQTRPIGFSPCGHTLQTTELAMAQALPLTVDCIDCIASGDELPLGLHRAMAIQDEQNRTIDEMSRIEDEKILRHVEDAIYEMEKRSAEETKERSDEGWTHEVCDAVEAHEVCNTGDATTESEALK